jgi:hypothetical protein
VLLGPAALGTLLRVELSCWLGLDGGTLGAAVAALSRLEVLSVSHCPSLRRFDLDLCGPALRSLSLSHCPHLAVLRAPSQPPVLPRHLVALDVRWTALSAAAIHSAVEGVAAVWGLRLDVLDTTGCDAASSTLYGTEPYFVE